MLSPCLFVILLAIGYFFIDKKTQTELINKCKKNKFMILGGLFFIYYFFLRNRVEGFNQNTGAYFDNDTMNSGEQIPNKVATAAAEAICYSPNRKDLLDAKLTSDLTTRVGWTDEEINNINGSNIECFEQLLTVNSSKKLKNILTYNVNGDYSHTVSFKNETKPDPIVKDISDLLDNTFKYNIEMSALKKSDLEPSLSDDDRLKRMTELGTSCSEGDTRACQELRNLQ